MLIQWRNIYIPSSWTIAFFINKSNFYQRCVFYLSNVISRSTVWKQIICEVMLYISSQNLTVKCDLYWKLALCTDTLISQFMKTFLNKLKAVTCLYSNKYMYIFHTHTHTHTYIYIYICIKYKVESFKLRGEGGRRVTRSC